MADGTDLHPKELEFRRRWYKAHRTRAEADPDYVDPSGRAAQNPAGAAEAIAIRDRLADDGDLGQFRSDLQAWANRHGSEGFRKGRWGMQFVGPLIERVEYPAELARLFADGFSAPQDSSSAAQKIDALAEYAERFKAGGHMHPMNVRILLPYFWRMYPDTRWPILWWSRSMFMEFMTGELWWGDSRKLPEDWPDVNSGNFYLRYVEYIKDFDNDSDRFQEVASWWHRKNPALLDTVLVDRCTFGRNSDISEQDHRNNTAALFRIYRHLDYHLKRALTEVLGYELKSIRRRQSSGSDVRVDWWNGSGRAGYDLRVWVNDRGAGIGISPRSEQSLRKGWYTEAAEAMKPIEVEGYSMYRIGDSPHGEDMGLEGAGGSFFYARWYERGQLAQLDLRKELKEAVTALQPAREALTDAAFPPDPIGIAARELLVDRSFLDDIVSLLEDKGQVILYGPPGTGKTYLAKRLAEALAPDSGFRGLVQFHPSTSYEDFFEGYRPVPAADGGIGYELTWGPLARMAAHAEEHPVRHVMVIDEINRANLPRVLGELLFLLEYREEQVSTLYRSEGEFRLPEALWFIGTMNTADRSIALVDAALRRRFHFVPFFPGRGPTRGLLKRWLKREGEPGWVDDLVAMVNGELAEAVGEDLQLGFSHFMREGYGEEPSKGDKVLRRIWQYNIEPFVEDQLFGDQARIEQFRFESVVNRFRSKAGLGDSLEPDADSGGSDDDQSDQEE